MNAAKTALLLGAMTALLCGLGMMLDRWLGTGSLMFLVFGLIGIVTNWVSYFYSDKIVLKLYKAREVTPAEMPWLHEMVDRLCARAGLPKPKVCIIPLAVPNAFATGRNPQHAAVACTEGILELLSQEELEAVIAHELGHVRNRDTLISTVAASLASVIGMIANMMQFGAMFGGGSRDREGGNPFVLFAMALLAPLVAAMVQMAVSRTREFGADRASAEMTSNPDALARALRRLDTYAERYPLGEQAEGTQHLFIVNPLRGAGIASLFSTHPPTEKRIEALERLRGTIGLQRPPSMPPPLPVG